LPQHHPQGNTHLALEAADLLLSKSSRSLETFKV
jgi:hypothetical protein